MKRAAYEGRSTTSLRRHDPDQVQRVRLYAISARLRAPLVRRPESGPGQSRCQAQAREGDPGVSALALTAFAGKSSGASRPVFIVNLPQVALDELRDPKHIARLLNPNSENLQQPAYAANWSRSIKPELLVLVGICTHLGCVPLFEPQPDPTNPGPNWPGGFFCPCHASKYDLAGRVFRGVPAPYNLPVPPHRFPDEKTLRIGENPPGQTFDFASIRQV